VRIVVGGAAVRTQGHDCDRNTIKKPFELFGIDCSGKLHRVEQVIDPLQRFPVMPMVSSLQSDARYAACISSASFLRA
jgi:hypothetical protein